MNSPDGRGRGQTHAMFAGYVHQWGSDLYKQGDNTIPKCHGESTSPAFPGKGVGSKGVC